LLSFLSADRMSTKLDHLKKIAELHMQREVDIMEMVMGLDNNDIELFYTWYINHPYSQGIRELQQIVRNKAD
jgi:hypothetical protein